MANQSPRPALPLNVPVNYPTEPTPGKIQILYDANKRDLYHKLSPYGYDTFLGIKTRQPFFYTYPDDASSTTDFEVVDQFQHAITDVQRVSKFMISQNGIIFLTKQFLLQTGNAFNETRIYNPTSPIVAAGLPLTLYEGRPTRHIDTSDLLGSFLGNIGTTIGGALGLNSGVPKPPAGTLGGTLPDNSVQGTIGGKGLLRAGTANKARAGLTTLWGTKAKFSLGGFLADTIKGIFSNFIPARQDQSLKRQDQVMYGLMLGSATGERGPFTYWGAPDDRGTQKQIDGVQQFWFGGSTSGIRKGDTFPILGPLNWKKLYVNDRGQTVLEVPALVTIRGLTGQAGYVVGDTSGPVRYEDAVSPQKPRNKGDDWVGSDILIQYAKYASDSTYYPTKFNTDSNTSVVAVNASLKRVIDAIQRDGVYTATTPESSVLVTTQDRKGYDRIVAMKKHGDVETQQLYSVLGEYRNARVLENQHSGQPATLSKKMASTNQFDGINTLKVLDKNKKIDNGLIPNWTEWRPYNDDQIAFYFYDVVNERYIPFRAIIRGLQETDSANWEELSFIGRADRLYSYSGYNRSLTFSFTVHISSIIELAPTWQRINYLMSLVKPSRYVTGTSPNALTNRYTKFIVPPMVMVTIGDLYKNQPVVIGSAGISIPDTAIWETLNQDNSQEWSYLVDYIKSPKIGKLYGQMPLTADISINAYILEQERAIAGAAHFGSAPRDELGFPRQVEPLNTKDPTELHKSFIVDNK